MTTYRDAHVDVDAILEDIRSIVTVESPTSHPAGVNQRARHHRRLVRGHRRQHSSASRSTTASATS